MISIKERKKIRRYLEKFPVAGSISLRVYKLFRNITFTLLHGFKKSATGCTQSRPNTRVLSNKRNWDLFSGERQTANRLDGIRKDHVNRYLCVANIIKNHKSNTQEIEVLDIFCGNGYGSYVLAKETKTIRIDAVDGSEEAINFAKQKFQSDKIKYYNYIFPHSIEVKSKYDYIVSLESIEHVENDKGFYNFLVSRLKDNSILFLSFPNKNRIDLSKNPNAFHFRHYDKEDMEELITDNPSSSMKLIGCWGQDVYVLDEKKVCVGLLDESKMALMRDYEGQFLMLVLKKTY